MREDPVRFIFRIITLGQNEENLRKLRYFHIFLGLFIECTLLLCGINFLRSDINLSKFMEFFTLFSFLQPGCATIYLTATHLIRSAKTFSVLRDISRDLDMMNPSFEIKILKEARKYVIYSIMALTLSLCMNMLMTPFLIDDGFLDVLFYSIKDFFGGGSDCIYLVFFILFLIIHGIVIMNVLFYVLYVTFHIQFQLMWLSMYIKQNLHENLGILSVENSEYQNRIQRHLIQIVKYRLMFKEAFSKIYISQDLDITLLSLGGVLTGVMCIYNLKNAIHQGSSIKLYLIIAVETIVMISLCVCGQTVADESIHMRDVLYECPWVYWNTRNRKILLIIITNIEKPWTISLYNLFILNNEMVIQAAKFVYSLATVVANMK